MPTTKDTRACLLTKLEAGIEGVNFDTASAALQEYNLESLRLQATDIDLQIRSHAATIYDYFGQNEKASAMVEGLGEDCYHALKDLLRTTSEFRASPIFREMRRSYKLQVIAVLQRGYVYYRRSDYANYLKALDHWKLCLEALTTCIRSTDYPCHGSIGRVSYAIGLAYRQLGPPFYLEAKRFFSNAIDHAWLDVEENVKAGQSVALSEYRVAKCSGLGLGWVLYTEANLTLARPLIAVARTLLADKPERLIKAYVDVVYACVEMAAKGDDLTTVDNALRILERAYSVFEANKHAGYKVRAANELALGHLRRAALVSNKTEDQNAAERLATEVMNYAADNEKRWFCNASIVFSRLHLQKGHPEQAIPFAQDALDRGGDIPFTKIDALIARGEGQFALGQQRNGSSKEFLAASRDFKEALEEGGDNPKVAAVCHLHLTRTYLRVGDFALAFHHWGHWKMVRDKIENSFVRTLGAKVDEEVSEFYKDFLIPFDSPRIDPEYELKRLHGFCYLWAMKTVGPNGTYADAAKLLGNIAVATLHNWRDDAGLPKREGGKKGEAGGHH